MADVIYEYANDEYANDEYEIDEYANDEYAIDEYEIDEYEIDEYEIDGQPRRLAKINYPLPWKRACHASRVTRHELNA